MIIALTSAATITLPFPEHRVDGVVDWQVTPGSAITFSWNPDGLPGQLYCLNVQATATSRVLTFGTNMKSTGTLTTGTDATKQFNVLFKSDGQNLSELSRTAAIA